MIAVEGRQRSVCACRESAICLAGVDWDMHGLNLIQVSVIVWGQRKDLMEDRMSVRAY